MNDHATSHRGRRLDAGVRDFEELRDGDWYETHPLTITEAQIDTFADLTGDRFELHMNDDAARELGFPGRVAHGLLVLSLVDGLKNQAESRFRAVASLGWNWRFDGPVFIGDTIAATITIIGKRETRRADRGIVSLDFDVRNQNGKTVQSGKNNLMVLRGAGG
jgi:3-hydroxybutyryl-CoA dehydratase